MDAEIPAEEEKLLARVLRSLADHALSSPRPIASGRGAAAAKGPGVKPRARYDEELLALRDEISEARLEDVPQLVAQMERLQQVSLTRADLQTIGREHPERARQLRRLHRLMEQYGEAPLWGLGIDGLREVLDGSSVPEALAARGLDKYGAPPRASLERRPS